MWPSSFPASLSSDLFFHSADHLIAALTKLSCLLANPDLTVAEIRKQMSISLRGELTEETETTFSHPKAELDTKLSALSALGYAIADQNLDEIGLIIKETKEFLLNQFDYFGNTPVVSDVSQCC
jgi:lysophospholipase